MQSEKTLLLVGATGSGKSTLVNALANFIFDVNWEDPFRLVLIDKENDEQHQTEALSQTNWVTCYKICTEFSSRLKYDVNIIDTPGFGHTGGVEKDLNIISQLKELFQSPRQYDVLSINAVCMVVKAPDARLTVTQKYIFQSVLSMFGKDILHNMCTIVTFADGQKPPVIASIAALEDTPIPYKVYFPVNNSALYVNNDATAAIAYNCWSLGNESYSNFFTHLENLKTQSLWLSIFVCELRDDVDITIRNLKDFLTIVLSKISTRQFEIDQFEQHKEEIKKNRHFTYEVSEIQRVKVKVGWWRNLFSAPNALNCSTCEFTCHRKCKLMENEGMANCDVMDQQGNCKECPDKCPWDMHEYGPWLYENVRTRVTKTYNDVQNALEKAVRKPLTFTKVIKQMKSEIPNMREKIDKYLDLINQQNGRLKTIALLKRPPLTTEYIDWLIGKEEQTKTEGYEIRIKELRMSKDRFNYKDALAEVEKKLKAVGD